VNSLFVKAMSDVRTVNFPKEAVDFPKEERIVVQTTVLNAKEVISRTNNANRSTYYS
jgi:hypothetical protein